jgi:hypothetical protein
MTAKIERDLRALKLYAVVMTFLGVWSIVAFRPGPQSRNFEEITAKRFLLIDSAGKGRVLIASDYKNDNSAGLYFFNQEGTEAGAFAYKGRTRPDGSVEAYAVLTMDQFKEDEVIRLAYSQNAKRKRHGLVISDMPDSVTDRYQAALAELRRLLPLAKTAEEANALRQKYLDPIPGRERGARRLFVGRDYDGQSLVTLSDRDGKARLRLQVDTAGKASIVFLDEQGRPVKTITP